MKLVNFYIPYKDDERLQFTSSYLIERGYNEVNCLDESDFVILPIPTKEFMLSDFNDKLCFYGNGKHKGICYGNSEAFKQKNAYLTTEGAIALLKNNSDKAIYNSDILITGYGKISQELQKVLISLGANVDVCCRNRVQRIKAEYNNSKVINFDLLCEKNKYDFIFNTVPHIIFTKKELDSLDNDTIIFDLASFPGGVDTLYTNSKNIKLVNGRGLPSKYSKIDAGNIIGEVIDEIIKEELM